MNGAASTDAISSRRAAEEHGGAGATLVAGARAGVACGLVFGLLDGAIALAIGPQSMSALHALGCLAGAVLVYAALWTGALTLCALVLHPLLARRPNAARRERMLGTGLALGLACEIYWWSRPYVFYGRPAVSLERLVAAGAIFAVALVLGAVLARALSKRERAWTRPAMAALVVACVGGGVYLLGQRGAIGARGAIGERNRELPNVLLVVVDALRQDVLGCYGHARVKTPVMDGLAREGVLFENAFVQAPFTWTSFGSLLTGKYPRRHGLLKMKPGVRMVDNVTLASHVKSARTLDGKQLSGDDWLCATFHTGTLTERSGLLRGFDLRFEATAGHDLVVLDQPWSVFHSDLLFYLFKNKLQQRFDSGVVASAARDWLARHGRDRFFAMVHLYSTHTPYDAPDEYKRMYVDPAYEGPIRAFYAAHREAIERGEYTPTAADVEQIKNLYYAGVSQADALIGELLAELERVGVRDETLVIVTSDHGESLGEHDLWEHNHMVHTNLRVPLILSWPAAEGAGLPRGKRVAARVDEIDVLPTVCAIVGIEPPSEESEWGAIDGIDLVPWIRGETAPVRKYSFAENGVRFAIHDERAKLVVTHDALSHASFADALAGASEPPRLYDLAVDPGEDRNVAKERAELGEELFRALKAWDASLPIPRTEVERSHRDLEDQERMRALGYTDGVGGEPEPSRSSSPPNGRERE